MDESHGDDIKGETTGIPQGLGTRNTEALLHLTAEGATIVNKPTEPWNLFCWQRGECFS